MIEGEYAMKKIIFMLAVMAAAVSVTACQGRMGAMGISGSVSSGLALESEKEQSVDLEKLHQAVKDAYGASYIPSFEYDAQSLKDVFGLEEDLYDEFIAEGPMISVHVDTFLAIKAREGKGAQVEEILSAYRKNLVENSMQYPMNLSKVEASQVIRYGDYVFFVMLGTASMEAEEQGEEAALESARTENQKAVKVIDGFFGKE